MKNTIAERMKPLSFDLNGFINEYIEDSILRKRKELFKQYLRKYRQTEAQIFRTIVVCPISVYDIILILQSIPTALGITNS